MDARVAEIGIAPRVEEGVGARREHLRRALHLGHDRRVLPGVRVDGAGAREVGARALGIERQEVRAEERVGGGELRSGQAASG